MSHQPPGPVQAEDAVILHSTPDHAVIPLANGSQGATRVDMKIGKFPGSEQRLVLRQQQQPTLLATHPKVILVVLIESPHIRSTQIECSAGILIFPDGVFPFWYPAESVTHGSDEQVSVTITDSSTQQQFTAPDITQIEKVSVHHAITIKQHAVDTDHQHATLIAYKARHRTVWRLKILNLPVSVSSADSAAVARFPEKALLVDEYITEVVGVTPSIVFQFLTPVIVDGARLPARCS